jgi:hypothetical protein
LIPTYQATIVQLAQMGNTQWVDQFQTVLLAQITALPVLTATPATQLHAQAAQLIHTFPITAAPHAQAANPLKVETLLTVLRAHPTVQPVLTTPPTLPQQLVPVV